VGQFYKIKLKPLEKLILSSMYVSSLSDRDPTDIIKEKVGVTDEIIDSKIQECISNHLINEDKKTLTEMTQKYRSVFQIT
jgi:hypothetical protein